MKGRCKFYGEQFLASEKQIELVYALRQYRWTHDLGVEEMAKICTLCGEPRNVKFTSTEIGNYERFKIAPREAKFQVLSDIVNPKPHN